MGDYVRYISGLMAVLALMLVISTTSGADANYDPVTKRTYDPFGSFFDEYGQYIDIVNNVVVDRYGEFVKHGYNFNSDSYIDSKGELYGSRPLAGTLKDGQWLFPGNYAGSTPIEFTKRSDGGLVGQYWSKTTYDPINQRENNPVQFTMLINVEKRYYVGKTDDQISWNLKNNLKSPATKEDLFTFDYAGQEKEVAQWVIREGIVDDDGFITLIRGTISNPDPASCLAWDSGFMGVAYKNGARLKYSDWACYSCITPDGVKDVGNHGCLVAESDDPVPRIIDSRALIRGELEYEADWLGDGQDISDPTPQSTSSAQPIGPTPYDYGWDYEYGKT